MSALAGPQSPTPVALRLIDVHVEYELFEERRAALRHRFATRTTPERKVVHAVRGVSFDVHQGESVGLLGSNGAGKSTLLAAISGMLLPSAGEILVSDEPKIMGVGATLLKGATGVRNIRLGCLALGLTTDEVDERIDEIIAFTELGDAIDRPIRTYSTGMRARLHFAIATAVRPRILLVDEALAVGDQRFYKKSAARIDELVADAGTFLLVSHSTKELSRLCRRGIWLDQGTVRMDGPMHEVLERYQAEV